MLVKKFLSAVEEKICRGVSHLTKDLYIKVFAFDWLVCNPYMELYQPTFDLQTVGLSFNVQPRVIE